MDDASSEGSSPDISYLSTEHYRDYHIDFGYNDFPGVAYEETEPIRHETESPDEFEKVEVSDLVTEFVTDLCADNSLKLFNNKPGHLESVRTAAYNLTDSAKYSSISVQDAEYIEVGMMLRVDVRHQE